MNKNIRTEKAFTLIELLVVIAIIGILAAIVLASLSGARERAQITRMASDLEQIELAFNMWMTAEWQAIWPQGSEVGPDSNNGVPLSEMVEHDNLGEYLPTVPEPPFGTTSYEYEYNGGSRDRCGDPKDGVNITVSNVDQDIIEAISDIIDGDDGDLDCGKVVEYIGSSGHFRYNLSLSPGF